MGFPDRNVQVLFPVRLFGILLLNSSLFTFLEAASCGEYYLGRQKDYREKKKGNKDSAGRMTSLSGGGGFEGAATSINSPIQVR